MSLIPTPFPESILNEIRDYPGNNKCCDCSSLDTDWGSISHGTLICLDCAGKHRSLGVHVSFVRSITMDTWSSEQIEMMRQGGNDQIRRFFTKLEIENSPIQTLYCTKGAAHYRERLKDRVGKIIRGELKPEPRNRSGAGTRAAGNASMGRPSTDYTSRSNSNDRTSFDNMSGIPSIPKIQSSPAVDSATRERICVMFGVGAMGMTLTKDSKGMAMVSRLVPGAAAQAGGVKVGDVVVGVAKKSVQDYDEIMHMIPCLGRPLQIDFSRVLSSGLPSGHSSDGAPLSANSTPISRGKVYSDTDVEHRSKPVQPGSAAINPSGNAGSPREGIHASHSVPSLNSLNERQGDGQLYNRNSIPSNSPTFEASKNGIAALHDSSPNSQSSLQNRSEEKQIRPKIKIKSKHSGIPSEGDGADDDEAGAFKSAPKRSVKSLRKPKVENATGGTRLTNGKITLTPSASDNVEIKITNDDVNQSNRLENDIANDSKDVVVEGAIEEKVDDMGAGGGDGGEDECEEEDKEEEEEDNDDEEDEEDEEVDDEDEEDEEVDDEDEEDDEEDDDEEEEEQQEDDICEENVNSTNNNSNDAAMDIPRTSTGVSSKSPEDSKNTQKKFVLEDGTVVKVLRDGRWRSAVIRRRHKDGTFKVTYRDTTSETHVPISRMAIERNDKGGEPNDVNKRDDGVKETEAAISDNTGTDIPVDDDQIFNEAVAAYNQKPTDPYIEYLNDQIKASSGQLQKSDDFVVDADVDLDTWIDNDDEEDLALMKEKVAISTAATKVTTSEVKKVNKTRKGTSSVGNNEYEEIGGEDDNDSARDEEGTEVSSGVIEFSVEFDEPPLGLTLSTVSAQKGLTSASSNQQPIVTRTVPGGKADSLGVQVGDILSKIDYRPVYDYTVSMQILPTCAYPLCLHFKRGEEKSFLQHSGEMMLQGSKVLAQTLVSTIKGKKSSILETKSRGWHNKSSSMQSVSSSSVTSVPSHSSSSSPPQSRFLDKEPGDGEFDVTFDEDDLGFKIDERFGYETVSVVTEVVDHGPAKMKGVHIGCIVRGVNFERYISYAHTVATIQHAKRPITVRFKKYQY